MNTPRVMLAAVGSGNTNTLLTCGLLRVCMKRNIKTASFKCGPDYMSPMFQHQVLGRDSRNLDTFLADEDTVRYLLEKHSKDAELAVLEGMMGYYDGIGGTSVLASAYDLARITDTPAVLVVNVSGMSLSAIALIQGLLNFQENNEIYGVILNGVSAIFYPQMKKMIESACGVSVYGYLPNVGEYALENCYTGLLMMSEIEDFQEKIDALAIQMEETVDIDGLLQLAKDRAEKEKEQRITGIAREIETRIKNCRETYANEPLRIAYAQDEAFCFFYADNLDLLREMGVELIPFSPLHDEELPENISGLLLYGGYQEFYAKKLSENESMRREIREVIKGGLPTIAESGGFLYLGSELQQKGTERNYFMTGVIDSRGTDCGELCRFGYVSLSGGRAFGDDVGVLTSYECHNYDAMDNGESFLAEKPLSRRTWNCIHSRPTLFAGFPHQYYYGNLSLPEAFVKACFKYSKRG